MRAKLTSAAVYNALLPYRRFTSAATAGLVRRAHRLGRGAIDTCPKTAASSSREIVHPGPSRVARPVPRTQVMVGGTVRLVDAGAAFNAAEHHHDPQCSDLVEALLSCHRGPIELQVNHLRSQLMPEAHVHRS